MYPTPYEFFWYVFLLCFVGPALFMVAIVGVPLTLSGLVFLVSEWDWFTGWVGRRLDKLTREDV